MSRTIRRTKFNKKNRFFQHYWEEFSNKAVKEQDYIEVWKYHSDNYYTKTYKDEKQFWKTSEYRKLRQNFRKNISNCHNFEDFILEQVNPKSIKWNLH